MLFLHCLKKSKMGSFYPPTPLPTPLNMPSPAALISSMGTPSVPTVLLSFSCPIAHSTSAIMMFGSFRIQLHQLPHLPSSADLHYRASLCIPSICSWPHHWHQLSLLLFIYLSLNAIFTLFKK